MSSSPDPAAIARDHLQQAAATLTATADACAADLARAASLVAEACRGGGKVLFAGNGGSATDAEHLAAELVNRLSAARQRPAIAGLALTSSGSILTATASDRSFEEIFARQIEALGRPGDVLVGLSTSGRSANMLRAFEQAKEMGLGIVAFLGEPPGPAAALADVSVRVPSADTQHIQEAHIALGHVLCLLVEQALYPEVVAGAPRQT